MKKEYPINTKHFYITNADILRSVDNIIEKLVHYDLYDREIAYEYDSNNAKMRQVINTVKIDSLTDIITFLAIHGDYNLVNQADDMSVLLTYEQCFQKNYYHNIEIDEAEALAEMHVVLIEGIENLVNKSYFKRLNFFQKIMYKLKINRPTVIARFTNSEDNIKQFEKMDSNASFAMIEYYKKVLSNQDKVRLINENLKKLKAEPNVPEELQNFTIPENYKVTYNIPVNGSTADAEMNISKLIHDYSESVEWDEKLGSLKVNDIENNPYNKEIVQPSPANDIATNIELITPNFIDIDIQNALHLIEKYQLDKYKIDDTDIKSQSVESAD